MSIEVRDADYGWREFPDRVFRRRYALHPEESFEDAARRVSTFIASCESGDRIQPVAESFSNLLCSRRFIPGGRILHGAGRPRGQLLNCFVIPIDDTLPAWLQAHTETALVSAAHGGVGLNFSRIRPAGAASAKGAAGGPLMAMRMINHTISLLEQTGGRRGALMFCLNSGHVDVEEFLDLKAKDGDIAHANISVNFTGSIRDDLRDNLRNGLLSRIIARACQTGEPGILNGGLANSENNIWYFRELISTNPCGEIWLEPYGCCCLGHINLVEHISGGRWDLNRLTETVQQGVRFLDNVLSVTEYPLQAIADNCQRVRRIGLGVVGLHHALIRLGYAYGSKEARDEVHELFTHIRDQAYLASVDLAKEKGAFQRFDSRMLASGYCQRLPRTVRDAIAASGIRNCALLTVAPTGTVSTVLGVSPGIEPIMGRSYERIWRDGEDWTRVACRDPEWDSLMRYDSVRDERLYQIAEEIPISDHLAMQATIQGFIDNSVSKTINIKAGTDPTEVTKAVQEYLPLLKGVTLYPAGAREASPFSTDDCPSGACDL